MSTKKPAHPRQNLALVTASASDITPEKRHKLIAEAAYYKAEQRGFNGDAHMQDWLAAEELIDLMLQMASTKGLNKGLNKGSKKAHYYSS